MTTEPMTDINKTINAIAAEHRLTSLTFRLSSDGGPSVHCSRNGLTGVGIDFDHAMEDLRIQEEEKRPLLAEKIDFLKRQLARLEEEHKSLTN